ncbi:hypothetical protein N7U66_08490 [Lacinutrix neustonica]|uniref:Uncharacterized protein n=1 Tax=Lacinutrix neustonica TaxID=2980107 RepID=A0A9E8MZ18_9FLAO|nr:hypothetical protein [Lacinutrix neustonica]WAC03505.1 hypothetical protein N7U66_08490 [Lacinutrix neustonica]
MTEQEIKSEITEKLNQGTSKSSLYNQFKDKIKDESLRKILASRPSYELKLKFKKAHLILSIIWGFFILLELIGILNLIVSFNIKVFISLILSIYITINIWKFDGRFFLPGIIWFVFTIFNSYRELDNMYEYDSDYSIVLIITVIYSLILVVGIYLLYNIRKNVFNYYNWFQPILNQDDEIQFEK